MITPAPGRVVWFYDFPPDGNEQPQAAIVAYVHDDRMVNLMAINREGFSVGRSHVPLVQEGDAAPLDSEYCTWMPYQIGQAKKSA